MTTLTELRKKILPLPSIFAKNEYEGFVDNIDESDSSSDSDDFNFNQGFGDSYAHPKNLGGRYILRDQFNLIGLIASSEPNFRQSGGIHTFDYSVSDLFAGYPKGSMLSLYDGHSIIKVESTEQNNTIPFIDKEGKIIPNVIDNYILDKEGSSSPKIYWKSASHTYGISEGLFSLNLDYSNAVEISNGDVVTHDSLVIGEYIFSSTLFIEESWGGYDEEYFYNHLFEISHKTNLSGSSNLNIESQNKGKCGSILGTFWSFIIFPPRACYVARYLGGSGNYHISLFAKSGTSVSVDITRFRQGDTINDSDKVRLIAIPILPTVNNQG